ncbi:hypothetical protein GGS23DRAFT_608576 [Durotheca rogersii]|uniref:uncharacterized protein n=1 Tax=Durotheca rogersii TaxID=419775 RepID=UPI00221F2D2D|nr:uncharacterized protein GGS23DRAFT_608576 [Durotheca rogersii]KAI5868014.1 hypothetical protein GGS23DRAFT_608576 [Durotheca rogersii]
MRPLAPPTTSLLASGLLSLILGGAGVAGLIENDFSAYPLQSQQCLYQAATASQCQGDTGEEMNTCLCRNGGNFVYDTADCVASKSRGDLTSVYETLKANCAGTGVTLSVSKAAFLSHVATDDDDDDDTDISSSSSLPPASASPTDTTTATQTTTTSVSSSTSVSISTSTSASPLGSTLAPSPAENGGSGSSGGGNSSGGSGLSQTAKLGLGLGAAFGVIALGLLAWFVRAYSRRHGAAGAAPSVARPSMMGPGRRSNGDLELAQPYGGCGSPPEYAPQGGQFGDWKPAADGAGAAYPYGDGLSKRSSGVPLLVAAELDASPRSPVELPTENYSRDSVASGKSTPAAPTPPPSYSGQQPPDRPGWGGLEK